MNKFGIFVAATLAVVAIPVGCSFLSTATTVATAPSRVINQTLETNNIIASYDWFFAVNAQYNSKVAQLTQQKQFLADELDPAEKQKLRMEVSAIQQSCRELSNNYNANSEKMNMSFFRDKDLPSALDEKACEI